MENKKYNTKSLVESGLISGIIIILMFITAYVPFVSFVGTILLPIPVAVLYMRHNIKAVLISIVVSTIITAMFFNPIQALISSVSFSIIGITLGYLFKKDKNSTTIIAYMTAASLLVTIITTILTIVLIQKMSFTEFFIKTANELKETINLSINMLKKTYESMGITQEQLDQVEMIFNNITPEFLMDTLGGGIIFLSFISGMLNYSVAKLVLQKLGYKIKKMVSFTEIYINSWGGLILTIPVIAGMILQKSGISFGRPIFTSGLYLLYYVFLMIGISVAMYFLRNRYNLKKGMIIFLIIITALNPAFSIIYIGIGFIDMLVDFRHLNPEKILKK